jgi:hypothetical protein
LVNINVGSLRGTSGEDGTISCPLSAKNFRNVDLISLTPLISVQSQYFTFRDLPDFPGHFPPVLATRKTALFGRVRRLGARPPRF